MPSMPLRMPSIPTRREACVLLVDDHAASLEGWATFFRGVGMTVRTAASGHEGLRVARAWSPDVVVLDLEMPSMNGLEVMDALRSEDSTAATRIVVFSGAGAQEYPGHRADSWVQKPCKPARLLAVIREIAARA